MAKDNITRYILLGLLSHEPMSGYDMKKRIDGTVSQFWPVGYGQIYPTLSSLEEEGLIEKIRSESSAGPQRHVYAITPSGRADLAEWLKLPEEKEYTKYEILLKLFFGGKLDPAFNIQRIEAFQGRYEKTLDLLNRYEENLKQVMDGDGDHRNYYLTVRFGQYIYKAYLDWAQEALHMLGSNQQEKLEDAAHEQKN